MVDCLRTLLSFCARKLSLLVGRCVPAVDRFSQYSSFLLHEGFHMNGSTMLLNYSVLEIVAFWRILSFFYGAENLPLIHEGFFFLLRKPINGQNQEKITRICMESLEH